jgi:hypothetical protein
MVDSSVTSSGSTVRRRACSRLSSWSSVAASGARHVATTRPWSLLRSSCLTCGEKSRGTLGDQRTGDSEEGDAQTEWGYGGRGCTHELEPDAPRRALHHGDASGGGRGRGGGREGPDRRRHCRSEMVPAHRRPRPSPFYLPPPSSSRLGRHHPWLGVAVMAGRRRGILFFAPLYLVVL